MSTIVARLAPKHHDRVPSAHQTGLSGARLGRPGTSSLGIGLTAPDKRATIDEIIDEIRDGMTIGIGGWGSRRKPMALVRALLRSPAKNLTVVSYGGPDVGLLCRAGKVDRVVYAFVSLDSIPLEPHFRNARQQGKVAATELDEGMFLLGLQAAAWRVPFLPTRCGLGSDILTANPDLQTIVSPYPSRASGTFETLVAMPALELDIALVHMHRGDCGGNGQYLNVDPYFDDLMCMAARRSFMSVEQIIPTEDFLKLGPVQSLRINRVMVSGVVETPNGAHFTECPPDYARDEAFQAEYAASAKSDDAWDAFRAKYLDVSEAEYQDAVASR
jgi:glutaconate CoA-transferase subunit A